MPSLIFSGNQEEKKLEQNFIDMNYTVPSHQQAY